VPGCRGCSSSLSLKSSEEIRVQHNTTLEFRNERKYYIFIMEPKVENIKIYILLCGGRERRRGDP
jgi:hypothetical protein